MRRDVSGRQSARCSVWLLCILSLGLWPGSGWAADPMVDARIALQQGNLAAAQSQLRNVIRADPQNAEAHFWLATVQLGLGDPVTAEREARAAEARGFDPKRVVAVLSQALLAQGKYQQLLTDLPVGNQDPELGAEILLARGYAQAALNDPDAARQSFAEAAKLTPSAVEPWLAAAKLALAHNDRATAGQAVDAALAAQPESIPALLAKAEMLRLAGDLPGAIGVLDRAVAIAPRNPQPRLARADLLVVAGERDKAQSDIDTVMAASPNNVQAIYLQAVMQANAKDFKAADASLGRIEQYLARIPRGYFLQAAVKQGLGELDQANDAARRYLARAPNDLLAYKALARIQLQQRRPDQAIDTLARIAQSGHADAEIYDLLGRAYAGAGRAEDSVQSFQRAEALAPNDVGVQTRLASVRLGMGQPDAAMDDLERTLQLAPSQVEVGDALFFAALATGDLDKAADAVAKIRAAQGETPSVANLEALLKLARLDLAGAQQGFNAILRQHPDFVPAQINLARVQVLRGHYADAEQLLVPLLDKQANSEPALTMLVALYRQTGQLPQAIATLERAHAVAPGDLRLAGNLAEFYIGAGAPQKALDLANGYPTIDGNAQLLGVRAAAQVGLEQFAAARDTYLQLLRLDPGAVVARRQLAALLVQLGDIEGARTVIKAGIALTPTNYQLYQDYVMMILKADGLDAGLAAAEQLRVQATDFPAAQALTGDVYLAAGKPQDAAKAYADALVVAPSDPMLARLGGALRQAGQPDQAAQAFQDWLAKHPDDITATMLLAEFDTATQRYDDAVRQMKRVLAQRPHDAVTLNNLAWVYQIQGNPEAQSLARQAYLLLPGPESADTLGWILTKQGQADTGAVLLRQASIGAPDDPRVNYHYAVALKDLGQRDEAIKQLRIVVAAKSDFAEKAEAAKLLGDLTKGS